MKLQCDDVCANILDDGPRRSNIFGIFLYGGFCLCVEYFVNWTLLFFIQFKWKMGQFKVWLGNISQKQFVLTFMVICSYTISIFDNSKTSLYNLKCTLEINNPIE